MQIPARTPAMTAMTAATLDTLQRRALPPRAGGVRPAGQRGVARGSVRGAAGRAPASTSRSCGWRCAATQVELRRASTSRCRCRTARARRCGSPSGRRAPTCRSTSRRSGRATCAWPARWPTAGSASSSRRSTPPTSSPPCGPGARPWGPGLPGDPMAGFDVRRVGARRRHRRPRGGPGRAGRLHRALHRRDGQPRAELLQRAGPPDGLRGGRRDHPGPLPRRPCARRRGRRALRADRRHGPDRAAASGSPSGSAGTPTPG